MYDEANEKQDAIDVARRNLYLVLSAAVSDPNFDRVNLLFDDSLKPEIKKSADLLREVTPQDLEKGPGEMDPDRLNPERLLEEAVSGREELKKEYRRVFGHTLSKDCPPCSAEYLDRTDVFYRSQHLSDVSGFYRAFGLRESDQWRHRVDHLSLMLEFMSHLITKRLYGKQKGHRAEDLQTCQDAERSFFEEHIRWWVPAFALALKETAGKGFYRALAENIASFVTLERTSFDLEPIEATPTPEVMEYDPKSGCGTCEFPGLAGAATQKGSDKQPGEIR